MIQANELRLGNWVIKKIIKYSGFKNEYFQINSPMDIAHAASYSPIELSEEILVKCGFRHATNKWYEIAVMDAEFEWLNIKIDDGLISVSQQRSEFHLIECKHLHQLQNLYYALCGQELNISFEIK